MEIVLQKFRISSVLKSFFFPLTSTEIFQSLLNREFEMSRPATASPSGPRVYLSGPIARKQGIILNIDENRKLVGLQGEPIETALLVFNDTLEILQEDFYIDLDEEIDYVELIAHYLIKSEDNPFEVIQRSVELSSQFRRIEDILKTEISEARISIAPKGVLPSSREYFEINLSPKVTMPKNAYWCEVIFRDQNFKPVIEFAGDLNSNISMIINIIEEKIM